MDIEKRLIGFLINNKTTIYKELTIQEESPDDEEMVLLEVTLLGETMCYKADNFFFALQELRKQLEEKNIQILCNGASEDVYPSPMQLSMGCGRKAYKNHLRKQAKNSDIVDIFGYDVNLNFVTIDKQQEFHNNWLKSLGL